MDSCLFLNSVNKTIYYDYSINIVNDLVDLYSGTRF